MSDSGTSRGTAAEALVAALVEQGIGHAFCVPGESYLAVLDALHEAADHIELITCRHEAGAANMAEAAGRLTGKPGICFVTRGPGATHAAIAVHTAQQGSNPLILFVGQAPTGHLGREAFQEVDYQALFGGMAKRVIDVHEAAAMTDAVEEAFCVALSDRPGPVVVTLPEDVLMTPVNARASRPVEIAPKAPRPGALDEIWSVLEGAARPLAILGGPGWGERGRDDMRAFLEATGMPAAVSFRSQDLLDNRHGAYAGDIGFTVNPALARRIKEADVILAVGTRLGEIATGGYRLLEPPRPRQKLVHIHIDGAELGKVFEADVAIEAAPGLMAAALAEDARAEPHDGWAAWCAAARADYEAWIEPQANPGDLQVGEVVRWLDRNLPEDAIVTNGAGNYAGWLHRHFRYKSPGTQLAPKSGAMGYGTPAAIAAKILQPGRSVVCCAGDGCLMMMVQELATAVRYGAGVVFVVFNNGMYGTIRMHQEKKFPGRVHGTDITNPDFAALAESFGARGFRVARTADFGPAMEAALGGEGPALIELIIDPEAISSQASLSDFRK